LFDDLVGDLQFQYDLSRHLRTHLAVRLVEAVGVLADLLRELTTKNIIRKIIFKGGSNVGKPIPNHDKNSHERQMDAYEVTKKLFYVLAEETASTDEGMPVVAQLAAQILLNLARGDKEEAIMALHYEFLPLAESVIEAINVNRPVYRQG
jgi:hypothetical protein